MTALASVSAPASAAVAASVRPSILSRHWPVCTLAAEYADVLDTAMDLTAMLSPDERTAVFAGTATRVYGL